MHQIALSRGQVTFVDDDIFELVGAGHWYARHEPKNNTFYAARAVRHDRGFMTTESLHHIVIGKPLPGYVVDHINGNSLDNRRENLRVVTYRQNSQNLTTHRHGRLVGAHRIQKQIKGRVYLYWNAEIVRDGQQIYLGCFPTEQAAHAAYLEACPH